MLLAWVKIKMLLIGRSSVSNFATTTIGGREVCHAGVHLRLSNSEYFDKYQCETISYKLSKGANAFLLFSIC